MSGSRPGLKIVRGLWGVFTDSRQIKKMAAVRDPLMRVVYSRMSDTEAAETMRHVVQAEPGAAKATMKYVRTIRDQAGGYETDRAYRIMTAARAGTTPAPIRKQDVELFERERALGWQPLEEAFDQLVALALELQNVRDRVLALSGSGARDITGTSAYYNLQDAASALVGPDCGHPDALVRSALADTVVARYLNAISGDPMLHDLRSPVWTPHDTRRRPADTSPSS